VLVEWAVAELAWLHLWGFRQKFELSLLQKVRPTCKSRSCTSRTSQRLQRWICAVADLFHCSFPLDTPLSLSSRIMVKTYK
jgi:hypothetical protein